MQLLVKGKEVTFERIIEAIRFRIDFRLLRPIDNYIRPKICYDVAEWTRNRGLKSIYLHDPIHYRQFPTEIYNLPPNELFAGASQDLEKPQELLVIEHPKLRGTTGVMYLPDGKVCLQGNWWRFLLEKNDDYTVIRRIYNKTLFQGDVYSLLCTFGQHYFHWLHDVLPRLYLALPHLPRSTRFLINQKATQFQIDSLRAFGITADRLLYQDDRSDTTVERLWFATPLGNNYFTSAPILKKVGEILRDSLGSESKSPFRKIYISRRLAANRRIVNEENMRNDLERRGFEMIQTEDLSFKEQVQLFSESKVVIAPHGAGLVNMLFMPPGGQIIEVLEPETLYVYYWILSADCGHSYHAYIGETIANNKNQPNIHVNPTKLLSTVDAALSDMQFGVQS